MSLYIRYHVHSLSGLLGTATKLFVKGHISWRLKLLLCIAKNVLLTEVGTVLSLFYYPSLLDNKVGGAVVVPPHLSFVHLLCCCY